ncbi:diguanylate cyclase [Actinoplanes sp. NPDC049548]|uniref:diguanylate cyclase domain-containing protein n=1 Tax=Actinoplanes sp. NPDC049548 TaxID=3155152 RepID=UPI00341EF810
MPSTSTRPVTRRRSLLSALLHPKRFFADLRISTKIVSVALVVASVFAAVGVTGLVRIRDLAAQQDYQYRTNVLALSHMTDARSAVGAQLEAVVSHILSEPGFYRHQYESMIATTDQRITIDLQELHKLNLARPEARALEAFGSLLTLWRTARDTALDASRNGDRQKATTILLVRSEAVARSVKTRADAVLSQLVESVAAGARASLSSSRATERLMLLSLVAGAFVAFTLSVLAARTLSRPLREAVDVLTAVGRGDFSRRLTVRGNDEVGQMGHALNKALVALRDAFSGLKHQAYHDNLTGLANRALLRELLTDAFARTGPHTHMALILIDLDGFKQINDLYGHGVGDVLLVAVGERLREGLHRPDDTAARLGGDEFAVLLDGFEKPSDAYEVAERLLTSIGQPLLLPEVELFPKASIGVALWNGHTDIDALIHDADVAMYAAKAQGKHNVVRFEQLKAMT